MENKPTLVLIHGFLSGPEYWHKQINTLSERYNVQAICLKGFSTRGPEVAPDSIEGFANDVIRLLEGQGIDSFYLLGHSMGGMIAQQIAHCIPQRVKGLILYGTGPHGSLPGRFEPIDYSIKKASIETFPSSVYLAVNSWFLDSKKSQNDIQESLLLASQASFDSYKNGLLAMSTWDGEDYLATFEMPTLIIWGDNDRSYQWESQPFKLWKNIPHSSLSVVNDCAHNVHLEKPHMFNLIVENYLEHLSLANPEATS
ncbi:alpha/beta fold hydrolase [Vibrio rumoiensis]|uniref:Alpha/beta fold hydrolase n=1 Tax=Vibrio rumoiensis TaxID=76258 RepID=A0ABW7IRN6_9VIBR